jgi:LPS export ABC transporter protein LptC
VCRAFVAIAGENAVKMSRWYRWTVIAAVVAVIVVALRTCGLGEPLAEQTPKPEIEASLTLQTVTLEQPDETGKLMWRLKAKAVNYSPDSQQAKLKDLNGEFFQAGQVIYTVTAKEGEVQQNGETLYLLGNLVATSKEDKLTLTGEKLKWQPKKDLLVMGNFKDEGLKSSGLLAAGQETDSDEKASSEDGEADSSEGDRAADSASADSNDSKDSDGQDSENKDSEDQDSAEKKGTKGNDGRGALPAPQSDEEAISSLENPEGLGNEPLVPPPPMDIATPTAAQFLADVPKQPPVKGVNPQLEAIAQVVTISHKNKRVELSGGVAAKSKETPWLTFESNRLLWFTEQSLIKADQPLKVEQYDGKTYEKVGDRVVGAVGQVNLADNIVTIDKSAQLESFTQGLKVNSETAVWDVKAQTVALDKPVEIEQQAQKVKASAQRGNLNLGESVITLTGAVRALGEENKAQLTADEVIWRTDDQLVEATGQVNYQQAAEPQVSLTGTRAEGDLAAGTVVVTGGESGEVVTEFIPGESF